MRLARIALALSFLASLAFGQTPVNITSNTVTISPTVGVVRVGTPAESTDKINSLTAVASTSDQDPAPPVAPPSAPEQSTEPGFVLGFGGGGSQYTDPHFAVSGFVGIRIAASTYEITSLDMTSKLDPATKVRTPISTIRTGIQRRLAQQGPVGLWAAIDGGVSKSDSLVGAISGGGAITYDLPKNLFAYVGMRVIKAPQADPNPQSPVQTAFTVGVALKFYGQKK